MAGIFCGSEFYVSVVIHEILSTKILRQVSTVVPSAIVTCTEGFSFNNILTSIRCCKVEGSTPILCVYMCMYMCMCVLLMLVCVCVFVCVCVCVGLG